MNLSKVPDQILLKQLDHLVLNERKQTPLILLHLNEVESRRLYEQFKCRSLFEYLNKHHGYSETSSFERMNAARLLRKAPEIFEKLQSGEVNMSQLARIEAGLKSEEKQRKQKQKEKERQIVLNEAALKEAREISKQVSKDETRKMEFFGNEVHEEESNKENSREESSQAENSQAEPFKAQDLPEVDQKNFILDLVDQVQNKTMQETQRILAEELNISIKKAQKRIEQKDKSTRLEFTLNEEQSALLKRAQSLMSHVVKDGDLAEMITFLAKNFVKSKLGKAYFEKSENSENEKPKMKKNKSEKKQGEKNEINTEEKNQNTMQSLTEAVVGNKSLGKNKKGKSQKRSPISIKVKRDKLDKAQYQCQHVDLNTGLKCTSDHQLQLDHIIPWAISRNDHPENLRVLCSYHNQLEAEKWGLGPG